ncbi:WG repeat-containing protein [Hymenobacter psychrophilus]|uniref:WG containing repeat-containing protein n=1 Tax=Hymenobacter psychrophilus TaxID=651662 RepID=A0A1H3HPX0_9BACT|nr:WG repeat-containing protein [Hymenobacter psychrophilus]SDY17523.1 WG containing repeat-containing protein [Hymenobacter psychrophilus]
MKRVLLLLLVSALLLPLATWAQAAEARLVPFRQGNRWGYADRRGRLVLPAHYDEAGPFADELAWVRMGNLYGYIDGSGSPVTPVQYTRAGIFRNNQATVELNGDTFAIDPAGRRLSPAEAFEATDEDPLEQGDVVRGPDGKVGFRFTVGAARVPAIYDEIKDNYNGLLLVRQGPKWGVLDNRGRLVQPVQYDSVRRGGSPLLPAVRRNGRWGYLGPEGRRLIEPRYLRAAPFFGGVARVQAPSGAFGYIDTEGREFWEDTEPASTK